jgi:hypothetical protein
MRHQTNGAFLTAALLLLCAGASADHHGVGRQGGVVVVPGHPGTGVVVGGTLQDPHARGHRSPIVYWSVYDHSTSGPPPSPSERRSPADIDVQPAGRLHLIVEPADSQVWVNGNPLPPGSDVSVGLLTGTYDVQVAHQGFKTESRKVSIEQAATATLEVRLKPEKP